MKAVSAGLDCGTDNAALKITKFSRGITRNQIKFLDGFWSRHITHIVIVGLVVVHAIQKEIVFLFAGAVHVGPSRSKRVLRCLETEKIRRNHAGRRYQRQFVGVVC